MNRDARLCKWLRDNDIASAADRIEALTAWIKSEGERSNTCTKNILGEICDNCQCQHKE